MNALEVIRARIHDWRHERRIRAEVAHVKSLMAAGQHDDAREANDALLASLHARSPAQIRRMEKRLEAGKR